MKILQYAHDRIVYTTTRDIVGGEDRLSSYLDELNWYFTKLKLVLKPQKCQTVVLKEKTKMTPKMVSDIKNRHTGVFIAVFSRIIYKYIFRGYAAFGLLFG